MAKASAKLTPCPCLFLKLFVYFLLLRSTIEKIGRTETDAQKHCMYACNAVAMALAHSFLLRRRLGREEERKEEGRGRSRSLPGLRQCMEFMFSATSASAFVVAATLRPLILALNLTRKEKKIKENKIAGEGNGMGGTG